MSKGSTPAEALAEILKSQPATQSTISRNHKTDFQNFQQVYLKSVHPATALEKILKSQVAAQSTIPYHDRADF